MNASRLVSSVVMNTSSSLVPATPALFSAWGGRTTALTAAYGKKKMKLHMVSTEILPKIARALCAQGINMVDEIGDDKEDEFLKVNNSVVLVFEIDVEKIVDQYKSKRKHDSLVQQEETMEEQEKEQQEESLMSEQDQKFHIQQIL